MQAVLIALELVGVILATLCLLYTLTAAVCWYLVYSGNKHLPMIKGTVPVLGDVPLIATYNGAHNMLRILG